MTAGLSVHSYRGETEGLCLMPQFYRMAGVMARVRSLERWLVSGA